MFNNISALFIPFHILFDKDPTKIDPVAAKQLEEQKKLEEEARKNVYSNENAMNEAEIESHGSTRSNALL